MATSQYTSQSASGYNSSPPPDTGVKTEANRAKWADVLTKLTDVLKTLADNINTQNVSAFAKTINDNSDDNYAMAGSLAFS
ncbi:MAG: hypothetical protein IIC82_05290, partial [Chloroflexi bacterium]|nr:hypothetical protein [Chloroflexota bacterium]